jgi:glycosyltransferase involved in cell wall biosynthesis
MAFPIFVKVWAGKAPHEMRYIRRSLPSLLKSNLPEEARVILVDDCSPNPDLHPYLQSLGRECAKVEVWRNEKNLGPNLGQEMLVPRVWERFPEAPFIVCGDDDVIYHPGWLQRLIQVRKEATAIGIDGVFTALNAPARPSFRAIDLPTSSVLLKERQMALNWLVPREIYERVGPFRATGVAYDTDYANRMAPLGIPVICLKPSWVQNIGYHGAYQNDETLTARDYVGRRDLYLVMRDCLYGMRRGLIITRDRIPEGRPKDVLKRVAGPIRKWISV